MLGFHVHFDQGYSNVEKWTSKKILRSAFSVISVYDHWKLRKKHYIGGIEPITSRLKKELAFQPLPLFFAFKFSVTKSMELKILRPSSSSVVELSLDLEPVLPIAIQIIDLIRPPSYE